ncbi:hypothetical protein GCM10011312_12830 [Planktosalinus lacus]|uniref:Secretion system C-terminal sorting domain-containing protein n=2 Tax=Planktosalinus lacus TaxID=1526573 RepID=A0A8J2VA17_9FLAO|nr:hypothetical protein GCM10011312_12830 [Planktosalinus lacus]
MVLTLVLIQTKKLIEIFSLNLDCEVVNQGAKNLIKIKNLELMRSFQFKLINIFQGLIITLCFQGFLLHQGSGAVYSQSLILQDSWHLLEGEINGLTIPEEEHHVSQFESSISGEDVFEFTYGNCFEFFSVPFIDLNEAQFSLLNIESYTPGNCTDPGDLAFIDLHNSFYFNLPLETDGTPKNPFNYTIEDFGSHRLLTIFNAEDDWITYRGITLLINSSFHQNSFALYPNPVKEILNIDNTSNQIVSASIYDINGKLLQNHFLETNNSTIDVKAIKQGLYFVVFESELRERVSKKFVKQ